ncbi:MAG: 50S ribosomal protein L23 [Nitrospirae bacterium CG_4_9_14_3_um_filter_53_35]|nr:MAG: 50S ribosomal protein L23 [Nitrospirae bacterium CG2_30_53_67]PIS37657.1 MAG: 50S ribosomal protein L23 [Nitrospirae bacterium CG08_land_8_20_14_0_20_52_24]PIV82618.1 MAG: 50S ribosomal protein L23 [Nitrospirae bacterium CG17_big_fil_post_rev_8_21_14_2_50_50_9]PIW86034.1 MAG: 50S ribosomal protein L23 [Nitrospirae bacterium CG_4_8_14_3_um_filter_50_41]PIX86894.1 MAG: 50S ribosomal protein L23 [Nitrospirae bacterium CG_4_10_14_3_um_filter_53_41]PJA76387.1 MAG: 50S ribosomal protein L23 
MNDYQTLIRPLVTEKNVKLKEEENKIFFEVSPAANRIEIKKAVERAFKVKVSKVNILNQKGKRVVFKSSRGKRKDWKKAIVTLKPGERVDYLEG